MSDFERLTHYYDLREAQHIILHGTEVPYEHANRIFRGQTDHQASCHYAIDQAGILTQYLDDDVRAWHAGVSWWGGVKKLNNSSIGIELECISLNALFDGPESTYTAAQMETLVPLLEKLILKHKIEPWNILAHGDVAPDRKWDPGVHFSWAELAAHGVGLWHDLEPAADDPVITDPQRLSAFRRDLTFYGYDNRPEIAGENHVNVIKAFQTHFLPWNICGRATEQSVTALDMLLTKKYGAF